MKLSTKLLFVSMAVVLLTSISIFGQQDSGVRSRGIEVDYDQGLADGMRVSIQKEVDNRLVAVLATEVFKSGDRIKLEFESNFDGFVYIVNVAPNGKTCLVFPLPSERNNAVNARQRYSLPQTRMLKFNEEKGTETLQVYMARQPISLFDDALKDAMGQGTKPCLGDSAANAAKELSSSASSNTSNPSKGWGIETKVSDTVLAQAGRPGQRPRGVHYDSGENNAKKEATIAIQKKDGDAHLKNGDVAFYQILLKHN